MPSYARVSSEFGGDELWERVHAIKQAIKNRMGPALRRFASHALNDDGAIIGALASREVIGSRVRFWHKADEVEWRCNGPLTVALKL